MNNLTLLAGLINSITGSTDGGSPGAPGTLPATNEVFSTQIYTGDGLGMKKIDGGVQLGSRYIAYAELYPATNNNVSIPIAHPKPGHKGAMSIVICGTSSLPSSYWSPDNRGGTQGSGQVVKWTYTALGDEESFLLVQTEYGTSNGTATLRVIGGVNNGKTLCAGSAPPGNSYGAAQAATDRTNLSTLTAVKDFSGACRPYNSTLNYTDDTSYPPAAPASYGNAQATIVITSDITLVMNGTTSPGGCTINGRALGTAKAATPGQAPGSVNYGFALIYFDPQTPVINPGGSVWIKNLTANSNHQTFSSNSPANVSWPVNLTDIPSNGAGSGVGFSGDGFIVGTGGVVNTTSHRYSARMFRKAFRFHDVVKYVGDGSGVRAIPHGLGIAPGVVIAKNFTTPDNPVLYHKDLGYTVVQRPNVPGSPISGTYFGAEPTAENFYIGSGLNESGKTYELYLWAHDPSETSVIKAGTFTINSLKNNIIDLGFEAQWVLLMPTDNTPMYELDSSREFSSASASRISLSSVNGEVINSPDAGPDPIGFRLEASNFLQPAGSVVRYLAIARNGKVPTSGKEVFAALTRSPTGAVTSIMPGFSPDVYFGIYRNASPSPVPTWATRLRGSNRQLKSNLSSGDAAVTAGITSFNKDGVTLGTDSSLNAQSPRIEWFLKRAKGFFDVTSWRGDGAAAKTIRHNLGVKPDLIIGKAVVGNGAWCVWGVGGYHLLLNATNLSNGPFNGGNVEAIDANSIRAIAGPDGDYTVINNEGGAYIAYLFANLAGICKVGTYTGTGTGNGGVQNIDCGFSNGARFIMIKSLNVNGNWFVMDTARGFTTANDPVSILNNTDAEITSDDAVSSLATGFAVKNAPTVNINAAGVNYLFLAIA